MKKVLFATTALVALGLGSPLVTSAQAQDKAASVKPISLSVGGYFRAFAIAGWQDDGQRSNRLFNTTSPTTSAPVPALVSPIRSHGIGRESEIHFRGETALNNGLRVGVQVELEGETSADQIDNTYLYFQHASYGRVIVGEDFGSSLKTHKGVVGLPVGLGSIGHFASHATYTGKLNAAGGGGSLNTFMVLDGVSDKLIYDTPRIFGFRLSGSYTPDDKTNVAGAGGPGESGQGLNPEQNGSLAVSQVWTVGADYINNFGGLGMAASAGYQRGYREYQTDGRNIGNDPDSWNVGLEFSYAGFRVGGAYKQINNNIVSLSNPSGLTSNGRGLVQERFRNGVAPPGGTSGQHWIEGKREDFIVGADYTFGPWTFGVSYGFASQHDVRVRDGNGAVRRTTDDLNQWTVGASYTLGPGITLFGGYVGFDLEGACRGVTGTANAVPRSNRTCASNDGHMFLLGTQLNF
ncbi:MAG: porin [Alphaproteobacteria bacterium]|nr:porin [Alphaproteobacteria bacterium]